MIKRVFKNIYKSIMSIPRERYCEKKRRKLSNTKFTIISSDCFGTFVYHTLGERFNSPTINLMFSQQDFLLFVSHLKEYLQADLIEVENKLQNYPIGQLTFDGKTIQIDFMHYNSLKEAKQKWDERKQRVDFSNIYVIQVVSHGLTQEYADCFSALPYKHKLLVTHENNLLCDCMMTHKIFSKGNYRPGEILRYKSIFSNRRHMDDIDYVSFLNKVD